MKLEPESIQERLTAAVSALHTNSMSSGFNALEDSQQVLQSIKEEDSKAPFEPPKHLLPPGVDSYHHPKVRHEALPSNQQNVYYSVSF